MTYVHSTNKLPKREPFLINIRCHFRYGIRQVASGIHMYTQRNLCKPRQGYRGKPYILS